MNRTAILNQARKDNRYRKQVIATLSKVAMESSPHEEISRIRLSFLSSTLNHIGRTLNRSGQKSLVTSRLDLVFLEIHQEGVKEGESIVIKLKWKFKDQWELGIKISGFIDHNFGVECEHLTPSEAAEEILHTVFSRM